jgi:hypothetical protein
MLDSRLYQIAVLASLLFYGMTMLAFDVTLSRVCLHVATTAGVRPPDCVSISLPSS